MVYSYTGVKRTYNDTHPEHVTYTERVERLESNAAGLVTVGVGGDYPTINAAWDAGYRQLKLMPGTHTPTADLNYDPTTDGQLKIIGSGIDNTIIDITDYAIVIAVNPDFCLVGAPDTYSVGSYDIQFASELPTALQVGWYLSTDSDDLQGPQYKIVGIDRDTDTVTLNQPLDYAELSSGNFEFPTFSAQPKLYQGPVFKHFKVIGGEYGVINARNFWDDGLEVDGKRAYWFTGAIVDYVQYEANSVFANNTFGANALVMNSFYDRSRTGAGCNAFVYNCTFDDRSWIIDTWPGRVTFMNCTFINANMNGVVDDIYVSYINCKFPESDLSQAPTMTYGFAMIACSDQSSTVRSYYYQD